MFAVAFIPAVHAATSISLSVSGAEQATYASSTKDIYVANHLPKDISVIDSTTNTLVTTVGVGIAPEDVVYAASTDSIIAVGTGKTTGGFASYGPLSGSPAVTTMSCNCQYVGAAFASSNDQVYISDNANNEVQVLDPSTMTLSGSPIAVGNYPYGVAFDPNNGYVYVINNGDSTVSVIDTSSNTVVNTINLPGTLTSFVSIAYAPSSNDLYVADLNNARVTVIDASNGTPSVVIPVGNYPYSVTFAPSNGDIYVTNAHDSTVSVIDTSSNTVVQTIAVGAFPDGGAFSPASNDIYVSNGLSTSVSVIDASVATSSSILTSLTSISSSLSGGLTTVEGDLTGLSGTLSSDFTSLSNGISGLSGQVTTLTSDLSTDSLTIQTSLSGLSTALGNVQASVTAIGIQVSSLSTTLSSDFSSLSSAISKLGSSGSLAGTSNDAAVVTSPSFTAHTSFSTGPTAWTQVAASSATDEVVSGYSISTSSLLGARNAILYVSLTNTVTSAASTYAIPLGQINSLASSSGQLRFPFRIPAGSTVYVQVVGSAAVSVTVQLQFLSLPIGP